MTDILFNNARGAASSLQMSPPFAFSDVTMSVFPLRASLPSLENFCRNYLSQAPNLVQFRPFVPFVYLVILDYGRMSLEAANMGWVSQREVAFGIPLRWLNAGKDGPEFHDWAFSSPFIFVDNELSMSTGREVYGWPKLLARLDPSVSEWVRDPHGARRVFQVSTKGTSQAYSGETSEYRPLLSVFQHRTAGLLDMPPSMDAVVKPLSQMSEAVTGLTRLGSELAKTFVGMASDRITGSSVLPDMMDMNTLRSQLAPEGLRKWRSAEDWIPGVKDALWSLFPRMYANTINFKQFRDAANPHATCYQALTAARMPVKAFKQGGFLGPQNMMLGQLDGGFRIDIHNLAGLPIVESLGLEVSEERMIGDSLVSTLAPVAPLWMKVDMTYGLADTLIWRGRSGTWVEGEALAAAKAATTKLRETKGVLQDLIDDVRPARSESDDDGSPRSVSPDDRDDGLLGGLGKDDTPDALDDGQGFDYIRAMNFFNTSRGASEAVGGSFSIPDASVRVLPLKAEPAALERFVRDYLRIENTMRFEAWGDFVYLVINDFKQMNSELSAISKRRAREMSLLVPVKCYNWFEDGAFSEDSDPKTRGADKELREKRGKAKLLTTGFVNAFTFVDDVETAITANEVFGVPSMGSAIKARENDWLSRDQSKARRQHEILGMSAQVLPELMAGARAVDRRLIGVSTHHPHHPRAQESEGEAVNKWVGLLADDIGNKINEAEGDAVDAGRGFALQLLGGDLPLNQFSLKQFRDSQQTQNACYQGLILRRHWIDKLTDFREIEAPIHVSITDYPTQPITSILGLKPKFSYPGRDRLVRVFEAIRPFSLNGDLRRGAGATLFERVNSSGWARVDITEEIFGWRHLEGDQIKDFVDNFKAGDVCELAYEFDNPEIGAARERRLKDVKARFLKSWYDRRVKVGHARNVMVRFRGGANSVSIVSAPEVLDTFGHEAGRDMAAWNAQMRDKHAGFSQSAMAAKMEKFSPATILDKVLSRRWGLSGTTGISRFPKNDFCVPVNSVPGRFVGTLFPQSEQIDGYWPGSAAFFEHKTSSLNSELAAFRAELNTAIHAFALLYPSVLHKEPEDTGDWSFVSKITALSEALNAYVDEDKAAEAKKQTKRALEDIENEEDFAGLMRATEAVVVQFFEAHLPDTFKLIPSVKSSNGFSRGAQHMYEREPSLEEWQDGRKGLLRVAEIIRQSIENSHEAEEAVRQFITPFVKRAEARINAIQIGAHKPETSDSRVPGGRGRLDEVLRERLHKAMTDQ